MNTSAVYAHLCRAVEHARRGCSERTRRMVMAAIAAYRALLAIAAARVA